MKRTLIYNEKHIKPFAGSNILPTMIKIAVIFFIFTFSLEADVKMPSIFSDNMILQRDIPLNIWGWASPMERVTVSFGGQKVACIADKNGKWRVALAQLKLCRKPQKMFVSGKNNLTFQNILVGDVWLCSGQSNMEMTVSCSANAEKEIAASQNDLIRQIKINRSSSLYPQENIVASRWAVASPRNSGRFSAVGYYFAKEIVKETNVPIGIINASWSGSRIEPWISVGGYRNAKGLEKESEHIDSWMPEAEKGKKNFSEYFEKMEIWLKKSKDLALAGRIPPAPPLPPGGNNTHQAPTMIFNAMINPLIKFGIRGVLWYQGEANGKEGESYRIKLEALISDWRCQWKQNIFPFYFVQLANFGQPQPQNPEGGDGWSKLRDAQLKTLSNAPKTGMAVAIDIGEGMNIHPKNKQDVGRRLAAWALAKEYGQKQTFSGPIFKSCVIEGNKARIFFEHTDKGLVAGEKTGVAEFKERPAARLKGFAIAGTDKKWHWAEAYIDGNTVVAFSEKVSSPIAVRYAYSMNPQGANLYNKAGFPASPFKTEKR